MYGFIDLLLRTPGLLLFNDAVTPGQACNERWLRQAAFAKFHVHVVLDQSASARSRVRDGV
jgi:hypothetical protein